MEPRKAFQCVAPDCLVQPSYSRGTGQDARAQDSTLCPLQAADPAAHSRGAQVRGPQRRGSHGVLDVAAQHIRVSVDGKAAHAEVEGLDPRP